MEKRSGDGQGLSVIVQALRLPQDGLPIHVEANEAERGAVAERFGIAGVERFEADLVARRWQGEGVSVDGALRATVTQTDVVTLEPLRQNIEEEVALLFVPEHSRLAASAPTQEGEVDVDPMVDAPETFRGDRIELGEMLVQILGSALDPYPRAQGAEFAEVREGEKEPSPFAVLAALRDRGKT